MSYLLNFVFSVAELYSLPPGTFELSQGQSGIDLIIYYKNLEDFAENSGDDKLQPPLSQ